MDNKLAYFLKERWSNFNVKIYDNIQKRYFVGRDHLGIIPVYIGRGEHGEFYVCSELKAFHDYAISIEILLPGIFILNIFILNFCE